MPAANIKTKKLPATGTKKATAVPSPQKTVKRTVVSLNKRNAAGASYDQYKLFEGRQYSGMKVGGTHKWYYDKGDWRDRKITPDLWEIHYAVTKRRAGHAPRGAGVPVGTGYHWYILAHQDVRKLNGDDYSTSLAGFKFKIAHHRAKSDKWSATDATQRKHMIQFLKDMIAHLEQKPIPLQFEYQGKSFRGEGLPVKEACYEGRCYELDITLNGEHLGIIRLLKSGWKMYGLKDQKLINAIGNEITAWYA